MNESPTDFNDQAALKGKDAVLASLNGGRRVQPESRANSSDIDDLPPIQAPPAMADAGFPGILGDVVEVATRDSEASPVAVAANFLALFAAMVGRAPYQPIGDGVCHARPFFLLVGKTGKARKGTSEHTPRRIADKADALAAEKGDSHWRLTIHGGGLSSGEGVGYALRDPVEDAEGKTTDAGVVDKRILIYEPEYAGVLAAAKREKNTLSAVIRNLWDGRDMSPLVKNSRWKASNPHGVIVGHITAHELISSMTDVDAMNGFMNRNVILHVARPKLVALPQRTPDGDVSLLAAGLLEAVAFATGDEQGANNTRVVTLSTSAEVFWREKYPELTKDEDGLIGALLVRSEIYARMFAMLFALLDRCTVIERVHIESAIAWINYWRASVRYIFGNLARQAEVEALEANAQKVCDFIRKTPGCSRSDLLRQFKHEMNKTALTAALGYALNAAPAPIREEQLSRSDGRVGRGCTKYWPCGT